MIVNAIRNPVTLQQLLRLLLLLLSTTTTTMATKHGHEDADYDLLCRRCPLSRFIVLATSLVVAIIEMHYKSFYHIVSQSAAKALDVHVGLPTWIWHLMLLLQDPVCPNLGR